MPAQPPRERIPQQRLGHSDLVTGALSLGSWHTYDRMDFRDAVTMLREAVEAGITLFDVGVYGAPSDPPPFTDVIFSAMVRAAGLRRDDYLFSAKLWLWHYPAQSLRAQLENALLRGGVEHADLVILGDLPSDRELDLGQLLHDLAELADAGLIRAWGVNNWSATDVQTLLDNASSVGVMAPSVAQLKYSVARRSIPEGAPFTRIYEQGMALQPSDILEGGVLAGKSGQARRIGRDPGGIRRRIVESADELARLSKELG